MCQAHLSVLGTEQWTDTLTFPMGLPRKLCLYVPSLSQPDPLGLVDNCFIPQLLPKGGGGGGEKEFPRCKINQKQGLPPWPLDRLVCSLPNEGEAHL